ncbi:hypothetical protein AHiyo8_48080 [Arthrobacter sp. Hiyo8]|nr:hypothetical protein AHiyo8_48080 [Arthrobacter sp. Hiyo8]
MAMSIAALVAVPSLRLRKAGLAETTWNEDIRWVAVTEQEDPQRFLNGGELILTTGSGSTGPLNNAALCARSSAREQSASVSAPG